MEKEKVAERGMTRTRLVSRWRSKSMKLCRAILWLVFLAVPASAQEKGWEKEWNSLIAGAKKEGKVVLAGFPNPDLRKEIPARFKQRFGIPVEYIGANSNETVAR